MSDRELNNHRQSHVDQNDKLNVDLLNTTCIGQRVRFRSSTHFVSTLVLGKSRLEYVVSSVRVHFLDGGVASRVASSSGEVCVGKLSGKNPDHWWIIALADSRCRSEHGGGRRSCRWRLADIELERPWADNVGRPALQFATKIASATELSDNGFGRVALAIEDSTGNEDKKEMKARNASGQYPPACPRQQRSNYKGGAKVKRSTHELLTESSSESLEGIPWCWDWNTALAGCSSAHACEWCQSTQHRTCACPRCLLQPAAEGLCCVSRDKAAGEEFSESGGTGVASFCEAVGRGVLPGTSTPWSIRGVSYVE